MDGIENFDPLKFDPQVWYFSADLPDFCFNRLTHTYYFKKQVIPGFSKIKEICGIGENKFSNKPEYAERGSFIHLLCEGVAMKKMDWNKLEQMYGENGEEIHRYGHISGHVRSYDRFLEHYKFKIKHCEKPMYHPNMLYGVTEDNIGEFHPNSPIWRENGFQNISYREGLEFIVELKSGVVPWWAAIQTAAQAMAYKPDSFQHVGRLAIGLNKNGNLPRPKLFSDPGDFHSFTAWHRTAMDKIKNGEYKLEEAA